MTGLPSEKCGAVVLDASLTEQPCGRPVTGWRWCWQHDLLDPACDWHANEGGRRMHAAEAEAERLRVGIEDIRDEAWEPWLAKDWMHLNTVREDCNALLNPTEGEDHE